MEYRVHLPGVEEGGEQLEDAARAMQQEIENCRDVMNGLREMTTYDRILYELESVKRQMEDDQQDLLNMTATLNRVLSIYRDVENRLVNRVEEEDVSPGYSGKVTIIRAVADQRWMNRLKNVRL